METYTLREAAALTGTSQEALRKRVDRGTIRSVKRDGVRRIPRSELERAGLRVGEPAEASDVVRELTDTIRHQERELASLRALPERVEDVRREREQEAERRAEAEEARAAAERRADSAEEQARREETATAEAQAAAEAAREWREQVARAGWRERRRMLREARAA